MSDLPKTMKAVVFYGPKKISVDERPVPHIQDPKDIIVRVQATALCGSELHTFRGHAPSATNFIMGHEFVGTVVATGPDVKTFQIGDKVVTPFTVSCGTCFYCTHSLSARCTHTLLFGSPPLNGGQAEYVRVPHADGTSFLAPPTNIISDRALILMADIFPTGFYGVKSALELIAPQNIPPSELVVVIIGCGPVGLCALVSAMEHKPKHLFAVDGVSSRLELAKGLGAEPLNFNVLGTEKMKERVREVTGGRGADVVVEVVGLSPALRTAYELVRPFGVISSIGVHNAEIPFDGNDGYNKNIRVQFGRCPVRSVFAEALPVLARNQDKFDFMFDKVMPLAEAVEGYDLFDNMKVQKVIFTP